jgi:hypothetical protein
MKADAWQAFFTGVAVLVAFWAGWSARRSASISRKQLLASSRPAVVDTGKWPEIVSDDTGTGVMFAVRNVGVGPALDVVVVAMQDANGFPQPERRSGPHHLPAGETMEIRVQGIRPPASHADVAVRIFYRDAAGTEHWSAYSYWRRGAYPTRVGVGRMPRDLWLPDQRVVWDGAPPVDDRSWLHRPKDAAARRMRRRPREQRRSG